MHRPTLKREENENRSKDPGSEKNDSGNNEDSDLEDDLMSDLDSSQEDEEDDGYDEQDGETNQNNKRRLTDQDGKQVKSSKIQKKNSSLYRLPTVNELNTLRETQILYHSNIFRMQMEEVLMEVSMKDKHHLQLDEWLTRFSAYLKSMPKSSVHQLNQTEWLDGKGVCDPVMESMPEVRGTFFFAAPTDVSFVGSFASGTSLIQNACVDVMITLPKKCIYATDWRNGSWLTKRTRYLEWLAVDLQNKPDLVTNLEWTLHLGCTSRPVLQVTPSGGIGKKWKVNLFPVPPSESFKVSRFSPGRSNLQPKWYFANDTVEVEEHPATPQYNWACAVDVVMQEHKSLILDCVSQHSNLAQGIKLIKIWLSQRGLDKGIGCFSGHMVTLFVIHLLQKNKIRPQMSAYQVFRNVIVALCSADWTIDGPSLCSSLQADGLSPETFHKLYEVVFIDPSGFMNIAATLISADYLRVKHEAQLALSFLDSTAADSFESLFIKKVEMFQFSDQLLSIKVKKKDIKQTLSRVTAEYQEKTMDALGDIQRLLWSSMIKILRDGLGERASLLVPMRKPSSTWPVNQSPPKHEILLVVGLVLDPTSAWALLTKGPAADAPEVENFKVFWGEHCSLRRFQDGSFHEAVLWGIPKQSVGERRLIPGTICKYLLSRHFGVEGKNVHYVAKEIECILHHPHFTMDFGYATGEEATVSAIQAFDSLSRKLRSLDLPLKIAAILPTSEVNRHARVFPPLAKSVQTGQAVEVSDDCLLFSGNGGHYQVFCHAMEVVVFLEISGKWPDDLAAIQAVKAEFHCKMSDLLKQDRVTSVVLPKFLQILWEGYIFRVRVCYRREIYLRRLVERTTGDWREQDTPDAIHLEKHTEIIPRFTSALASIQAGHPSFSGGVRLCKRWVGSQLLLPHLPHTAVELLVAYLYLSPAPYTSPHTPHVAFLRFLHLLSHTDWKTTPIFVNLNEAFTVADVAELNRRFTSRRPSLPHMFLTTPYELRSVSGVDSDADLDYRYKLASLWTKSSPSVQILYRCKQLAEASLCCLNVNLMKSDADIKTIFRPSYDDYDVIIKLAFKQLSRIEESLDPRSLKNLKVKPYEYSTDEVMPVVMFDAAQLYLRELRHAFNHLALFFHDEHGGNIIGVVWKPQALVPQEVKVGNMEGQQLVGVKEVKQVANVGAILSDFDTIGAGLVHSIVTK
ncbi:nucleolar protein 6 isoform X1 [Panulirus ornatus]|uniref:nucleolar protein 6 isoform X1 n=1 Tax=Panulirus ornatus TaxID=150431 RepID=UPI003A889787